MTYRKTAFAWLMVSSALALQCGCDSSSATAVSSAPAATSTTGSSNPTPPPTSTTGSSNPTPPPTTTTGSSNPTPPPTSTGGSSNPTPPPTSTGGSSTAAATGTAGGSNTAAVASAALVTTPNNGDACLAITMPTADAIFASPRRVFAHYVPNFPMSIDNQPASNDFYNKQYLQKSGESGKFSAQGGYIRQRPLPVTPGTTAGYRLANLEHEIRLAIARGITGFAFDVMSTTQVTDANSVLNLMLTAAKTVDSRFKIMVMPDMTVLKSDSNAFVQIVTAFAKSPSAYRLPDGRLAVSPFDAGLESVVFWEGVLGRLNTAGVKVAFVPTLLGWNNYAEQFNPFSYGFGEWGTATPAGSIYLQGDPDLVRTEFKKIFMMPSDPQQFRPKNFQFWEASNSGALRAAWMAGILGGSEWMQLVTWNDFSESSMLEPFTDTTLRRDIGTGHYNLSGYYAAWYLSGQVPKITHDVLYWFYRREPTTAVAPAQQQVSKIANGTAKNNIELLAFLTAPAELKIQINGHSYVHSVPAGLVSFMTPTEPGTPTFTLTRSNATVFSFNGGVQIYGKAGLPSGTMDLTYWSGSASKNGVCTL